MSRSERGEVGRDPVRAGSRVKRAERLLTNADVAIAALLAAGVLAAIQEYLLGPKPSGYMRYNNFRIYVQSFWHLLHGQDLYVRYPAEHWDLFKYSPTFAAFMAPFALVPEWVGLVLWNVLNAGALAIGLSRVRALSARDRALVAWFLLPEALTAFQNLQVNVLLAGLAVLAYVALEEERPGWAALFIVGATYLKIYPAVVGLLALLHPRRRAFLAWAAVWLVVLGAAPLVYASPGLVLAEYRSWTRLLESESHVLAGLSVGGILHSWFHLDPPRLAVTLAGAAVALLPLVRVRLYEDPRFRLSFLGSLLVWIVVFNHTAESATFSIAVAGVALSYFAGPRGVLERVLLGLVFVFTSMSPRFPGSWVHGFIEPYAIKAVPCVFFWAATVWRLARPGPVPTPQGAPASRHEVASRGA